MELDYKKLGKHIKEQRLKQHLTQEKLGEIVGVATIRESYTPFKRIFSMACSLTPKRDSRCYSRIPLQTKKY